MQIDRIKVGELVNYVNSQSYLQSDEIAITRLRAYSQSINPRADADDMALLVARDENNRLLSYVGMMPDTIWIDNQPRKIWTTSCWWGNPDIKENGSMNLFYLSCKIARNQIFLPDLTSHLVSIVSQIKAFSTIKVDSGMRGYLRLNLAELLPSKHKAFGRLRLMLLAMDYCINLLHSPVLTYWEKRLLSRNIDFQVLESIDDRTALFIEKMSTHELFRRGKTELNWILSNPWMTTDKSLQANQKYAFTHAVSSFGQLPLVIYRNGEITAFLILLFRNGIANLTYLYAEEECLEEVIDLIYLQLIQRRVHTFTAFHPALSKLLLKQRLPFIFTLKQQRGIAFPKEFEGKIGLNQLQYGDADCAFV